MVTAKEARDMLQTSVSQAGADQRAERDNALKKLLQGQEMEAKQQMHQENLEQKAELAREAERARVERANESANLRRELQKNQIDANKGLKALLGGRSSDTAGMTAGQFENQVNKLSERLDKSGVLDSGVAIKDLNESIGDKGLKITNVNSALPQWMVGAGEALGKSVPALSGMLPGEGATEQLRSFEKITK